MMCRSDPQQLSMLEEVVAKAAALTAKNSKSNNNSSYSVPGYNASYIPNSGDSQQVAGLSQRFAKMSMEGSNNNANIAITPISSSSNSSLMNSSLFYTTFGDLVQEMIQQECSNVRRRTM
jgi:hypothetical protein